MNWYKKIAQVGIIEDVGTQPPDIIDDDDNDDEGGDWEDCYLAIQQWVKSNLNKDPLLTIQKQLIENTAINVFQQGPNVETMLWHGESLDFFRDERYRAATISMKFIASDSPPSGDNEGISYFDLNTMKNEWKSLLQSSTVMQTIQGAGCRNVRFIEDELYNFILGEIMNGMCYQNKYMAETFQTYLEKNIKKIERDIINDIVIGSGLTQFCPYNYLAEMKIGEELSGHNLGFKCYPSDYRFDQIGIVFVPEMTVEIEVPDWLLEKVLKDHGEYGDEDELV